ncbi:MAG TPA: hypothetical protein VFH63_03775 [candidate division Zixibacteria bacterium]|nr:hypothetical protein [candidate division Zixibacteria bacterium]
MGRKAVNGHPLDGAGTSGDRRRLALLVAIVAVVGHQLALAIGYGPGARVSAALRATQHGGGWELTVLSVVLAGAAALAVVAWQIRALRTHLARAGAASPAGGRPRLREVLSLAHRVFAASIVVFLLQENAEHAVAHGHLPGFEALLAGQYVATVPTFVLLSLAVAAVAVHLTRHVVELHTAVVALSASLPRAATRTILPRPHLADRRALARCTAGLGRHRAPPALLGA